MFQRVLVVDPAFLGDVVFNGPLLRKLARNTDINYLGIVVRPPGEQVAEGFEGIDRVHSFDKYGKHKGWKGLSTLASEIALESYDLALVPHTSLRSALLVKKAGIPKRIGLTSSWLVRPLFQETIPEALSDSFVRQRLRLLSCENSEEELSLSGCLKPTEDSFLDGFDRIGWVLGAQWATKRWAPHQLRRALQLCFERGWVCRFVGAEWERPLMQEALQGLSYQAHQIEDFMTGSVRDLLKALGPCKVVVGGDTGPVHMARAVGIKAAVLFGPTYPNKHHFSKEERSFRTGIDCSPCSPHGPKVCPKGHHRCMTELPAEEVIQGVEALLRQQ